MDGFDGRDQFDDHGLLSRLKHAFSAALVRETAPSASPGKLHSERSRNWIAALAEAFKRRWEEDPTVRVLHQRPGREKRYLKWGELLYDIHIVRLATAESVRHKRPIEYVTEALLQVESEFEKSSDDALEDFSKLVAGAAPTKLFVASIWHDTDGQLRLLVHPAGHCSGTVYLTLLPHPKDWPDCSREGETVHLYRFNRGNRAWDRIVD